MIKWIKIKVFHGHYRKAGNANNTVDGITVFTTRFLPSPSIAMWIVVLFPQEVNRPLGDAGLGHVIFSDQWNMTGSNGQPPSRHFKNNSGFCCCSFPTACLRQESFLYCTRSRTVVDLQIQVTWAGNQPPKSWIIQCKSIPTTLKWSHLNFWYCINVWSHPVFPLLPWLALPSPTGKCILYPLPRPWLWDLLWPVVCEQKWRKQRIGMCLCSWVCPHCHALAMRRNGPDSPDAWEKCGSEPSWQSRCLESWRQNTLAMHKKINASCRMHWDDLLHSISW